MLAIPIEQRNLFLEEGRRRAARIALALTPPINDAGIKAPQSRAKILLLLYSAMDTAPDILAVIYRAVDSMNAELPPDRQLAKAAETSLLGAQSVLDSLHLVSLLIAIEQEVADTMSVTLTLADERALSMKESPFRTIQSVASYIEVLIAEAQNA